MIERGKVTCDRKRGRGVIGTEKVTVTCDRNRGREVTCVKGNM